MRSRRLTSPTADLFAAAATVPAPAGASAVPSGAPGLLRTLPSAPAAAARPRRQLWYAAVFPALRGMENSAPLLHRLALHAQRFTSLVSIEPPDALLLEINGSLALFGPLPALHAALDDCWRTVSAPATGAAAPSALAALWFARAGDGVLIEDPAALSGRLAGLPIACTGWDAQPLQTLRSMGVTRLGELLRLPRAGLARRLGSAAVRDLDLVLGRLPSVRRTFVPRTRFKERCDFDNETGSVGYLEKALEPLIGRCARFLRERQAGIQVFQLRLRHRSRPPTRVRLGLASVTGERRRLNDVLVQKLARLRLAAPVRGVELISGPLQPLPAGSLDAFAGSCTSDTAPQLVERLRARLGEDAVYGLCSLAEHRPEAACGRVHELGQGPAGGVQEGMPRPVWILEEPTPLSEQEIRQLQAGALDSGTRPRTHRERLVGRQGRHPRLLQWRAGRQRRPAVGVSGAAQQAMVRARHVRLRTGGVRRTALPEQFLLSARRLAARGAGGNSARAGLSGARPHR